MGTNTGLKRVSGGRHGISYKELLNVRRRFVHKAALRNAICQVARAIFTVRYPAVWGEGTTSCASDSKKFGSWDQNLMTEWHIRYGGRGVMIYWHVEKESTCIYSQLKRCSSSEVAAMIEGVLRHCTDMDIEKQYVDSHGQSEVAFAFSYLLRFDLLPRLKAVASQKLYRTGDDRPGDYPYLEHVLTRAIKWELIIQQYDEMIKYATASKQGTAELEAILRRFTRNNVQHPTYKALAELEKAIKTIFLCRYIGSEDLRIEINEGLNVVENWNSANAFFFMVRERSDALHGFRQIGGRDKSLGFGRGPEQVGGFQLRLITGEVRTGIGRHGTQRLSVTGLHLRHHLKPGTGQRLAECGVIFQGVGIDHHHVNQLARHGR